MILYESYEDRTQQLIVDLLANNLLTFCQGLKHDHVFVHFCYTVLIHFAI